MSNEFIIFAKLFVEFGRRRHLMLLYVFSHKKREQISLDSLPLLLIRSLLFFYEKSFGDYFQYSRNICLRRLCFGDIILDNEHFID